MIKQRNHKGAWRAVPLRIGLLLLLVLVMGLPTLAQQEDIPDSVDNVYVTVQDFAVLRLGPGLFFERMTVLPPEMMLRATGRTLDGQWIQVAYTGALEEGAPTDATIDGVTYGWVAYWLLVWSGDILELPVDGVETVRYARLTGPNFEVRSPGPLNYVYEEEIDPSRRVDLVVTDPTLIEFTGRIGGPTGQSDEYFWLQFRYNGQYYWTASWAFGVPPGYANLPDGSYIFPYGRLLLQLSQEVRRNGVITGIITRRWTDLDGGLQTTCNNIPEDAAVREDNLRAVDVSAEPIFQAAVVAMQDANAATNRALARFREVCGRPDRFVTPDDVALALIDVEEANRNLTIARTLLTPLQRRNPLLGQGQ
ncbi:MAG: hypothetical protein OHK0046_00800 [Anaerolineae bacterium]